MFDNKFSTSSLLALYRNKWVLIALDAICQSPGFRSEERSTWKQSWREVQEQSYSPVSPMSTNRFDGFQEQSEGIWSLLQMLGDIFEEHQDGMISSSQNVCGWKYRIQSCHHMRPWNIWMRYITITSSIRALTFRYCQHHQMAVPC